MHRRKPIKTLVDDVPKALLPKLANILVQLENTFSFADNLTTELDWIHRVSWKFRAATRGVISSSKSGAAALAMQSVEYFSTQMDALDVTVWTIAGTQMTSESTDEFFQQPKAVHVAKQQELPGRTGLSRFESFSGHLNETQHDVNLAKEALYNLSKMVCTHRIHRIHRCLDLAVFIVRRSKSKTPSSTFCCSDLALATRRRLMQATD